jgi:dolichyl-phosphate-mannose--protein O-mannosyl transferase
VYLTFALAQKLTKNNVVALLSALLASLDGLLLSQSRIAMNDIYVTAFMVATLSVYVSWLETKKPKYLAFTSVFVGLAIATKWSGVFLVGIIGCVEGFLLGTGKVSFAINRYVKLAVALIVIPIVMYFLSYGQFFLQGHTLDQFKELHRQIIAYQFHLDATHSYQSQAWQWPLLIRPVWQHVDYTIPNKVGNIYAMGNPLISWLGLVASLWLVRTVATQKKYRNMEYVVMVVAYFAVWVPWIFSPRIMFYYHYTPAIPFLCIILATALHKLYGKSEIGQSIAVNSVGLIVLAFILFYPHWVGMPISKAYSDWLFWLPTWR